jgi:RNA polymerase sigma factor (sigma-70 family)
VTGLDELLRRLTPQVVGTLVRRHGMFDLCEDAVQEALAVAASSWPEEGIPDNPRAWLVRVAARRLTDYVRADQARRRREEFHAASDYRWSPAADDPAEQDRDDSLALLFLCCHPALNLPSQIALTLRSVGGLTTEEIASAYFVPVSTMGQRISRAKQRLRDAGARFAMPTPDEAPDRLAAVLHVLYLVFNEGYRATAGESLVRTDLTTEAIRLTRQLHALLPDDGEVAGLLALMLLTDARRAVRVAPDGSVVPLSEQDRGAWDRDLIAEGVGLLSHALRHTPLGPYQLQAAIAAIHDEAPSTEATDWPQILGLYTLLEKIAPSPIVALGRAVALAMVSGPEAGLRVVSRLEDDRVLAKHHSLLAVRAHLSELAGETDQARDLFLAAARRTTSEPEKRYLERKARSLST